jgi:glycosyltransferase involved in cell wall biosynthesis
LFDRKVARQLDEPMECFVGFAGQALHSFRVAKKLGCRRFELVAGNSHVSNCVRKHAEATKRHPIEKPWLNGAHVKKTLAEYEMADMIWVASEYSLEVFTREGVSAQKVGRIHYATDPKYMADRNTRPRDGVFRIVYCGAVSVAKGVPLLLEAFARLAVGPAELTLVGGTSTRGMKRYMDEAMARDARIKLAPGDPLPHLRNADVCVHPSWEDNLAYAPLEALRAGVRVIVTADTGMKEYVVEAENGYVVPTGDVEAILERLTRIAGAR